MSVRLHLLGVAIFILGIMVWQSESCCCCGGCCCRCCQYCCPQPPIIIQPPPALHNVCHVPCCCRPCCCCGCCGGRRKRSDPVERRKITKLNRLCKQMDPVERLALAISSPQNEAKPLRAKRNAKNIKVKKLLPQNTVACKC